MKNILLIIFLASLVSYCEPRKACTEEFAFIGFTIQDNTGQYIQPDSFFTIKVSSGDTVMTQDYGYGYEMIIFSDNQMQLTNNKGEQFVLTVYIDGEQIIKSEYIFAHDDCHVFLKEGNTEFVLP